MSVKRCARLFALLVLSVVLLASGCGASGSSPGGAPSRPANASPALVEQWLGQRVELAMLLDTEAMRNDEVYGRLLRRPLDAIFRDAAMKWLLREVDSVEAWMSGIDLEDGRADAVAICRSGRISANDLKVLQPEVTIDSPSPLPSGAVMYTLHSKARSGLAFLVDGSLVFTYGRAAGAAHTHFLRSKELPPRLGYGPGVLIGISSEGAWLAKPSKNETKASRYTERLTGASAVLRTGSRGDVSASATFDAAETADAALHEYESESSSSSPLWQLVKQRCPTLAQVKTSVVREDRTLTWRAEGLPGLLEALLDDKLCPRAKD